MTPRFLHVLVAMALGVATYRAGATAATVQSSIPMDFPTGRVCVLCDFGKTPSDPILSTSQTLIGLARMAEGADGALYGTSPAGGGAGYGTAYRVTRDGRMTVLYAFGHVAASQPEGGLTGERDAAGKPTGLFYGVTVAGGVVGTTPRLSGTIFSLASAASGGAPPVNVIYNFRNGTYEGMEMRACPKPPSTLPCGPDAQAVLDASASFPNSPPVVATDGALFGVATVGSSGAGVLYRMPKSGGDRAFHALCKGGPLVLGLTLTSAELRQNCMLEGITKNYATSLVASSTGRLYGTLVSGAGYPSGAIFEAFLDGRSAVIFAFPASGIQGGAPYSLISGSDGALYGTTLRGGANNGGVVFRLAKQNGTWTNAVLAHFGTVQTLGMNPFGGLVEGWRPGTFGGQSDGFLYGTTRTGLAAASGGVIYRVGMNGSDFKVLHVFPRDPRAGAPAADPTGRAPAGPLVMHTDGSLYGTASQGGEGKSGVVFNVSGVDLRPTNTTSPIVTITQGSLAPIVDNIVEVRTGEVSGQMAPSCSGKIVGGVCVLPGRSDDQIRIDVKNCRSPHVVQFVNRHEQYLTRTDPITVPPPVGGPCLIGPGIKKDYPLDTWHADAQCGRPNAFYDQNPGSGRVLGPYTNTGAAAVKGAFALAVFDQPGLSEDADRRSSADFKSYIFCNCRIERIVRWSRVQTGKSHPVYNVISILPPAAADIAFLDTVLASDGYIQVPHDPLVGLRVPSPMPAPLARLLGLLPRAGR